MVQAIHTAVPGRARYKVEGLYRSESLKKLLELQLAQQQGIGQVTANPLTGNILVTFNSANTPTTVASLIVRIVAGHGENGAAAAESRSSQKANTVSQNGAEHEQLSSPLSPNRRVGKREKQSQVHTPDTDVSPAHAWHLLNAKAVLATTRTSPRWGLSDGVVKKRLATYGPNVLPEAEMRSGLVIVLEQFNSLPVGLLGVAAGISLFTGGLADAVIILGVVLVNATIGYVTESQSERTIHSLKSLVRPSAVVVRDGVPKEISATEIVPGDLLVLKPGSYIAADSRLIEARRLSIDESALTGESVPVNKVVEPLMNPQLPLADRVNMAYMGTLVTGGQGLAVVVATGRATEIGKIQMLAGEAEAPETPLEQQLDQLGSQLVLLSGGVCAFVFFVGLLRGYGLLQMLKTSISLAVAAVPEGLPTIATTTLALGIANMRQHRVLIRRLDAVETLGCVQTICLDKTGTLTLNRMSVVAAYAGMRRLHITESGFTVEQTPLDPVACEEVVRLAQVCVLCSETEIELQNGRYVLRGSPTENALVHMAMNAGIDVPALRTTYPVQNISLRAENRNFMSTVHSVNGQEGDAQTMVPMLAVKGSPTEVLAMCTWQIKDGVRVPLTESDHFIIETENDRMAGEALRILGGAYRTLTAGERVSEAFSDLAWLGLVGMADPIRPGVKEVIGDLHQAGIETVMITGDQSPTAYAIGKELSLSQTEEFEILDSTHLANVAPEVMTALAERVHVFARVKIGRAHV